MSATAYLNIQVSSPGLSPIQVPSTGSPAEVSTYGPERCVQGSQGTKRASRYTVPHAYCITAHPLGQRCVRPPAYYKHQKLLATPGQRTGGLISREGHLSIPMRGSNCLGSQTQNSVPEDSFNETTHHVLLHGLSLLPLPNRVHTLSSQ